MTMSLVNNKTGELWRSFMPRRREIQNNVTAELISMQVYAQPVEPGNLNQQFEKWAAIEVPDFRVSLQGGCWNEAKLVYCAATPAQRLPREKPLDLSLSTQVGSHCHGHDEIA